MCGMVLSDRNMDNYIKDNVVEEVLQRTSLVDIVSEHVRLNKRGKNFVGLCPFHTEKTPSFNVSPEKNLYYCFGCGAGGNAINFIMNIQNYSFREALEILAERAGIQINLENKKKRNFFEEIYKINELAQRFFSYLLWNNENAAYTREYLDKRGVSLEISKKFGLGFAPDSWQETLNFFKKRGFDPSFVEKAGLVKKTSTNNYYDIFRNRLIFPIYNSFNRIVGFGGRKLSDEDKGPKYLNTPETEVFQKSKLLYGLNWGKEKIRKAGRALIVEGYMDVIACHQYGIENSVASLGTSFTQEQASLLKRNCDEVIISFDSDAAGSAAVIRGLNVLNKAGCHVKVLTLPSGSDPDDFLRNKGKQPFIDKINIEAQNLMDYKLDMAVQKFDILSPEGKTKALNFIINDLAVIESAVERQHFLQKAILQLQLPENAAHEELVKARKLYKYGRKQPGSHEAENEADIVDKPNTEALKISQVEKILLRRMLEDEKIFLKIKEEVGFKGFSDEIQNILQAYDETLKENGSVNLASFIRRLTDNMAACVSSIFTEEENEASEVSFEECIRNYKIKCLRKQEKEMLAKLSQAEKDGDNEAVNTLVRQLNELQKKIEQHKSSWH